MIVVDKRTVEFALTIAAIPVTIVILFMAALFTRRESRVGMVATIVSFGVLFQLQYSNTNGLVPLLCRHGLFYFQTRSDVPTSEEGTIPTSPKVVDDLCRDHYYPHHPDNHQRLHMHRQFQPRTEAAHQRKKIGKRRRKSEYDGDAKPVTRARNEPDDNRLGEKLCRLDLIGVKGVSNEIFN